MVQRIRCISFASPGRGSGERGLAPTPAASLVLSREMWEHAHTRDTASRICMQNSGLREEELTYEPPPKRGIRIHAKACVIEHHTR